MTARDDKIRQVVAELDVHIAEVEASVAVLKAILADGEVAPLIITRRRACNADPNVGLRYVPA